jgi:hypothetical protein
MILYVNGDSHSAGAETYLGYCFADDDPNYAHLGRKPHPVCAKHSYGQFLATQLGAELYLDAESASSNDRIIRTTREYLKTDTPDAIVIGWTSWEREEWLHDGVYWQVNAAPPGADWPKEIQERHRDWVLSVDYNQKRLEWHERIWQFHNEIKHIPHLFFNCFSSFSRTPVVDWAHNYVHPYDDAHTYRNWLLAQGFQTVSDQSYHFPTIAHSVWAKHLYPKLTRIL